MTTQSPEQTRAAWDQLAEGFDRFLTPRNMPLAKKALQRAGIRPDMRVLDVAAGSGALSIPAARMGAQVLGTDISPGMVERLAVRAREEGLANLESRVMDGQALDLADDTFDIAASQFGVMLFPDLPQGLSEMTRVTKPGGPVLMVTFGPVEQVEFMKVFVGAIRTVVPGFSGPPMDPPPLPFQVSDPDVLHRRMAEAGLNDISVETVIDKNEVPSGKHFYDTITHSNPIGAMLVAGLSEEQKASVVQVLDRMFQERSGGRGPAVITHPANIGIGVK